MENAHDEPLGIVASDRAVHSVGTGLRVPAAARTGGWIQTFSGVEFHPFDARPEDFYIEDIAHGLSHLCRFAGHVREFYSVAEHSVRVSWACAPEDALQGLLHDATEAYLIDLPSPIKHSPGLFGYRHAEHNLRVPLAERFHLPFMLPDSVEHADKVLLMTEKRDLLGPAPDGATKWGYDGNTYEPLSRRIRPWSPILARHLFLARYTELASQEALLAPGTCGACNGPLHLDGTPLVRELWQGWAKHFKCNACGGGLYHNDVHVLRFHENEARA
jgi:hypothetical protein